VPFANAEGYFIAAEMQGDGDQDALTPAGVLVGNVDPTTLQDINFDDGTSCACNIMLMMLVNSHKQRIILTYIVMPCIMRRKRSLSRSRELINLMHRQHWSGRRIRRFNWRRRKPILGMILRNVERDPLGQAGLLSLTVSQT